MRNNITQIYHTLLEGKTIRVRFPNTANFYSFRSSLYKYKKAQEDLLKELEVEQDNKFKIKFSLKETERKDILVEVKFVPKEETNKNYTIEILDSSDEEETWKSQEIKTF
jgi:hypothetical protein